MRLLFALAALLITNALFSKPVKASPADRFVSEGNFSHINPDTVLSGINAARLFINYDSAFLPISAVSPATLSILAIESSEAPLDRVRYRMRYGVDWVEDTQGEGQIPLSYIEVIRFNIGPIIRQTLIDDIQSDEHVAEPNAFGVGSNVAWRIVTKPLVDGRIRVVAAGRGKVLNGEMLDCFSRSCLAPWFSIDTVVPWSAREESQVAINASKRASLDGLSPADAIDLLLSDSIEFETQWSYPSIPEFVIEAIIEVNLAQDSGLEVAYRREESLDDSVEAIWQRLAVGSGYSGLADFPAAVYEAYECTRGPRYAMEGEVCP